jgi:hypothetical protein
MKMHPFPKDNRLVSTTKPYTIWGCATDIEEILPGILDVSTPEHGGLIITEQRFSAMPYPYNSLRPFSGEHLHYEEDEDFNLVVASFPEEFASPECNFFDEQIRKESVDLCIARANFMAAKEAYVAACANKKGVPV